MVDFVGQIFGIFAVSLWKKIKTNDIYLFGGLFTESKLPNLKNNYRMNE